MELFFCFDHFHLPIAATRPFGLLTIRRALLVVSVLDFELVTCRFVAWFHFRSTLPSA